jgi:hypothetical protein
MGGGRPGIDGLALDQFCLETCRSQDLCKRHAKANLPDLATCDAYATFSSASAKEPESEPGTAC